MRTSVWVLVTSMLMATLIACGDDTTDATGSSTAEASDSGSASTTTGTTDLPEPTMGLSEQTLAHDGLTRDYLLYVPSSYDGSEAVPLLLNFHGGTDSANNHMSYVDMRSLADAENFILIYPQAALEDGETNWNNLRRTDINKRTADDFGFIASLIDTMAANYRVDTSRVYATGYSNGAGMTYALGCQLSDKIAAIAPVSGLMPIDSNEFPCSPSHPTSVMVLNGTNDYSRPYAGINGYMLGVDEAVAFWTGANNLTEQANTTAFNASGLSIERYDYVGGEGGAEVRLYKVNGGDHVWFNFPDDGVSHNQVIWNFLSRFNLNGAR